MSEIQKPITVTIHSDGRRKFLFQVGGIIGGLAMAGAASAVLQACGGNNNPVGGTPNSSFGQDVSSLTTDGSFLVTSSNGPDGFPVVVFRNNATSYLALSTQCTHQACQVGNPSGGKMRCPCHGSVYSTTGAVINGPASNPLQAWQTSFNAGTKILTIS